ncbi:MAG: hypothetical protein HQ500_10005 [Flavobacteriales bacterium]|nr:hypothetical protein [Flavobacteriales bacterium]
MRYLSILIVIATLGFGACKNSEQATTKTEEPAAKPVTKGGRTLSQPIGSPKLNPATVKTANPEPKDQQVDKTDDGAVGETGGINTKSNSKVGEPTIGRNQFFGMYRSPCFGQCPIYNLDVDLEGHAVLEGKRFFDYIGFFEADFSQETMQRIVDLANQNGYFGFEHRYDANVTDVPSVLTILRSGDQVHWVYDRMGAPEALQAFEREVEELIKGLDWKEMSDTPNDGK